METLLFIAFLIFMCLFVSGFTGLCSPFIKSYKPSKVAEEIIKNIQNCPEEWRISNSNYFYNRERKMVFCIMAGLSQFNDVGGKHRATLNYYSIMLSVPDRVFIYKAYEEWLGAFTELNMSGVLPEIELTID